MLVSRLAGHHVGEPVVVDVVGHYGEPAVVLVSRMLSHAYVSGLGMGECAIAIVVRNPQAGLASLVVDKVRQAVAVKVPLLYPPAIPQVCPRLCAALGECRGGVIPSVVEVYLVPALV